MPVTPRRRTFRHAFFRWLAISAAAYLGVCAAVAWQKEAIIFPQRGHARAVGKTAPTGYETWWQTMRDGVRVEAWWRPAGGATSVAGANEVAALAPAGSAPAVIVFHGNGELIDDSIDFADAWHKLGVGVLLVEYRGYGRSGGEPGIGDCRGDADEWYDRLAREPGVRRDVILAHGFSLGGVFAAELAARRAVAGLVLESTVANLRRAALDRRIAVLFTRERFDATAVLRGLDPIVPVLLTHGTRDEVVPFHHHALLAQSRPDSIRATGDYDHHPMAVWDRPELLRNLLAAAMAKADKGLASPPVVSAR